MSPRKSAIFQCSEGNLKAAAPALLMSRHRSTPERFFTATTGGEAINQG
jgi:hypothetical protein